MSNGLTPQEIDQLLEDRTSKTKKEKNMKTDRLINVAFGLFAIGKEQGQKAMASKAGQWTVRKASVLASDVKEAVGKLERKGESLRNQSQDM